MNEAAPLLSVEHLTMRFGGLVAIDDLSFDTADGEITAIIGPNGAGKTTIFNLISRLYEPSAGSIHYGDQDLLKLPAHKVVRTGIGRTFQNIELFEQARAVFLADASASDAAPGTVCAKLIKTLPLSAPPRRRCGVSSVMIAPR